MATTTTKRRRQRQPLSWIFLSLMLLVTVGMDSHTGCLVDATEIKWTPGDANQNDAAATAPRSQKYWDEHGIERPDYAKTDQEIAAERAKAGADPSKKQSSRALWLFVIFISAGLIGGGYLYQVQHGGSRLGGRHRWWFRINPFSSQVSSEEEARQARLAKFEHVTSGKHE